MKEEPLTYMKVLSRHLPTDSEKNLEKPWSGHQVNWRRYETGTSQMEAQSHTATLTSAVSVIPSSNLVHGSLYAYRFFWYFHSDATQYFRTVLHISLKITIQPPPSPWRWRQHGPPKRWYPATQQYMALQPTCTIPWLESVTTSSSTLNTLCRKCSVFK